MLVASALVPAVVAASHLGNVAYAANDEGLVRVLGLGWTGAFRGADTIVSALFLALPLGTRAARAALAGCVLCGLGGAVLYLLARRLLAACGPAGAPGRFGSIIAAVASMTATLSAPWQLESTGVAGAGLGALLVLAPLALLSEGPLLALGVLALGLSYEPLVGLAALAAAGTLLIASGTQRALPRLGLRATAAVGMGLLPLAIAIAGRRSPLALVASPFARSSGEGGGGGSGSIAAFLHLEVGWVGVALAIGGVGLALFARSTAASAPRRSAGRAQAAGLSVVVAVGLASATLGAPVGPSRYGAPVLAALGALWVLAAVAMDAITRTVATAKIPLAAASAAMIVVLEVTFPVLATDDTLQRMEARGASAAAVWSEVAFGALPARSVLLVRGPRLLTRLLAARATGELRPDLSVVPLGDIVGPLASRELRLEPRLAPLWRNLLLSESPDEWALSSLASARSLGLPFEPRWERAIARHFVPSGLLAIFAPEPRGASDRTRALDAFVADRERLDRALQVETKPVPTSRPRVAIATSTLAESSRDAALLRLTSDLLLDRALTFASIGERDLATRALEETRPFGPDARVASELTRRLALPARGPLDVTDLAPR